MNASNCYDGNNYFIIHWHGQWGEKKILKLEGVKGIEHFNSICWCFCVWNEDKHRIIVICICWRLIKLNQLFYYIMQCILLLDFKAFAYDSFRVFVISICFVRKPSKKMKILSNLVIPIKVLGLVLTSCFVSHSNQNIFNFPSWNSVFCFMVSFDFYFIF